jgi:hypothetical protein
MAKVIAPIAPPLVEEVLANWNDYAGWNGTFLEANKIMAKTGCSRAMAYQVKYRVEYLHAHPGVGDKPVTA